MRRLTLRRESIRELSTATQRTEVRSCCCSSTSYHCGGWEWYVATGKSR